MDEVLVRVRAGALVGRVRAKVEVASLAGGRGCSVLLDIGHGGLQR